MHVGIQVAYCHYMLTPSVKYLWHVKFCLNQEGKSIALKIKGQAMVLRINVLQYNRFMFIDIDYFSCEKKLNPYT